MRVPYLVPAILFMRIWFCLSAYLSYLLCVMRVRVAERSGRRDGTQRPGRESALHTQVRGRGRGSGLGSGDGRPETPECAEETSRRVHEPSHAFQLK